MPDFGDFTPFAIILAMAAWIWNDRSRRWDGQGFRQTTQGESLATLSGRQSAVEARVSALELKQADHTDFTNSIIATVAEMKAKLEAVNNNVQRLLDGRQPAGEPAHMSDLVAVLSRLERRLKPAS